MQPSEILKAESFRFADVRSGEELARRRAEQATIQCSENVGGNFRVLWKRFATEIHELAVRGAFKTPRSASRLKSPLCIEPRSN